MTHQKPNLSVETVISVLQRHWGRQAENVTPVEGGNLSSVYFFSLDGVDYVIHFSELEGAFERVKYVSRLLSSHGVPYPRIFGAGVEGPFQYQISSRIAGTVFADLQPERKAELLPDLVRIISDMNQVNVEGTSGFGWLKADGNGAYASWDHYITSFYAEDQTGTFWENWHELFRTSCLERDVFEECYARLVAHSGYNAPHRYFVHGDCHPWNILSDGRRITGIIDDNSLYGDFMIDIATIEDSVPGRDVVEAFRIHYEKTGKPIAHFSERLNGARYFKGLDAMRFYAKMGWNDAYVYIRDRLLALD